MGKYTDVSDNAGLIIQGMNISAAFADFDNDGFHDLFVMRDGGDILYRNTGNGTFEDVTGKANAGSRTGREKSALF